METDPGWLYIEARYIEDAIYEPVQLSRQDNSELRQKQEFFH